MPDQENRIVAVGGVSAWSELLDLWWASLTRLAHLIPNHRLKGHQHLRAGENHHHGQDA